MFKKVVAFVVALVMGVMTTPTFVAYAVEIPELETPAYVLMEASTGRVICSNNAEDALHPASVTKIMTLILIFDALESGKIKLEDEVTVSENAASMGGSQVFLEAGEIQTVDTMIKCISVASANDACVAMAEYVAGSEAAFVDMMNKRASELGMENTHFVNCCGLDADMHKMSALDVAIMSRELIIKYPQIHSYSMIWMDTITHTTSRGSKEFGLSNTNKLIKQYQWATGLKTGSTGKAKCCLSATAKKDNIELIAVVMAAPNSKTRFEDAITLLNYGYSICRVYEAPVEELGDVKIAGGVKKKVRIGISESFRYLFLEEYDKSSITTERKMKKELSAPIKKGEVLGEVIYKYNDKVIGKVNVIALDSVEKSNILDYYKKILNELVW